MCHDNVYWQEILGVCKHLLLSSAPGQFDLILNDLRSVIFSDDVLSTEWLDSVRLDYYEKHMYLKQGSGSRSDDQPDLSGHLYRQLSKTALCSDDSSPRIKNVVCRCAVTSANVKDARHLTCSICRQHTTNIDKGYAGAWTCKFTAKISSNSSEEAELLGKAVICSHSFEDGNVQLNCEVEFGPKTLQLPSTADDSAIATIIAKQLLSWEEELLQKLLGMYANVGDFSKSMRRVMPLTRRRMDWNVQSHRLVKTLNYNMASSSK